MSATMNEAVKSATTTRSIRKVEAPRPLKKSLSETKSNVTSSPLPFSAYSIESVDKLVILMDMVVEAVLQTEDTLSDISGDHMAALTNNIAHLCKHLKIFGPQLENTIYQGQLDRACSVFRDAITNGSLDYQTRVHILDILELRLNSWKPQKLSERNVFSPSNSESESFVGLSDLKNYVKNYSTSDSRKTSKSQTKNQCKDEVIIRNADSGKVAPTAKERLVQITGANEENVLHATRLIGDTIKRNTSPVFGMISGSNSSTSSSVESFPEQLGCDEFDGLENGTKNIPKEKTNGIPVAKNDSYLYKHKVFLSNCQLTITGEDYTYVTVAKAVLDDYFSKLSESDFTGDKEENVNGNNISPKKELRDHRTTERSQSVSSSHRGTSFSLRKPLNTYEPLSREPVLPDISSKILVPKDSESFHLNLTNKVVGELVDVGENQTSSDTEKMNLESGDMTESFDDASVTYTKEFLLSCRLSKLSLEKPEDWDLIASKFSALVKTPDDLTDVFEVDKSDE